MEMNKNNLKAFAAEIQEALAAVAAKYNLEVKVQGGKYTNAEFTPKIVFTALDENGAAKMDNNTAARADWELFREGLKTLKYADIFGKTFELCSGRIATLTDYNNRSHKFIGKLADGRLIHGTASAWQNFTKIVK